MSFICKFCRYKMEDCVQCITCLDISCKNCGIYCSSCDTFTCKRCPEKDPNSSPRDKMYCNACKEILCKECSYLKTIDTNKINSKYCLKNDCYKEHIGELLYKSSYEEPKLYISVPNLGNYIDKLKKEITGLKAQLECVPGGKVYQEVREHFEANK